MFEKGYNFRKVQTDRPKVEDVFLAKHIFTFICRYSNKYIVWVEEYRLNTFIIKFHLKSHNKSKSRYETTTKLNDISYVLRTCVDVMISFYEQNPYCSFGFVGAPLAEEKIRDFASKEEKTISNNKRFRVYKGIMLRLFSPVKFHHRKDDINNVYFLINRDNQTLELERKIIDMFREHYDLGTFEPVD